MISRILLLVLIQTLGTAACRVKPLMSDSVELEAVSVTVRPESDCFSQLSVTVTPSFSYTVTVATTENTDSVEGCISFKSVFSHGECISRLKSKLQFNPIHLVSSNYRDIPEIIQ